MHNPYKGLPGFFNHLNRWVYPLAGPAQIGIGRPEEPYVPPADPQCPICGKPMVDHHRSPGTASIATRLYCPR